MKTGVAAGDEVVLLGEAGNPEIVKLLYAEHFDELDRSEDRPYFTSEVYMEPKTEGTQIGPERPIDEVARALGGMSTTSSVLTSNEEDTSRVSDQENAIGLKYLELSRAEILERLKLSNQFLIVYLGGISALVGWLFTAKDPTKEGIVPQNVLPAVATGLSFLAFSLSWILSENERMVELLAKYQIVELGKCFHRSSSLPLWEESLLLKQERPSTGAMLVHLIMINAPNITLTIAAAMLPAPGLSEHLRIALIAIAIVLSCFSCWISFRMIRRRTDHRDSIQ
jgi:hypothetical protein